MNAVAAGQAPAPPAVRAAPTGVNLNLRAYPPRARNYRPSRRHAPPRTRQEKDFLARQGYIY
jgi:hypothetical protein